jgi:tetratricopeptide (TPR) repeat protein
MSAGGERLGKDYRIAEVRRGGMGEVYICDWVPTDTEQESEDPPIRFALKTFQRRFFFDNASRLAFEREAVSWLRVTGAPFVMPALGVEEIDGRPFVRMLAVGSDGGRVRTLADRISRGALPPLEALRVAFQLALALSHARERVPGLVHGDLKPGNVLYQNSETVLVSDFGLATAAAIGRPDTRLVSEPAYRAPELWGSADAGATGRSDVYAFGVLLYELLTAQRPVASMTNDADGWRMAHEVPRVAPASFPRDGVAGDVMALALACQAIVPDARPADFADVVNRIGRIADRHDPVEYLMWLVHARDVQQHLDGLAHALRASRVRGMIAIGRPDQALAELDELDDEAFDEELWAIRGMALSLQGRDEEALSCFERTLAGDVSESQRVRYESEYALSLKRLGRFSEARAIYDRLLPVASTDDVSMIVVNLATVLIAEEDHAAAINLLAPFTHSHPDVAAAWANLGIALAAIGKSRHAEYAYQRVIELQPGNGMVRTLLGALYMDQLGRIDLAWPALDAAFDLGYESRDLIVRLLTCAMLLDRRDDAASIVYGLRTNVSADAADAVREEALAMGQALIEKFQSGARKDAAAAEAAGGALVRRRVDVGDDEYDDSRDEQQGEYDDREEDGGGDALPSVALDGGDHATKARDEGAPLPLLNVRYSAELDFTIDFYEDPATPDYLDTFVAEWRRAERDPRMQINGASLRGSPVFMSRCTRCGVYVLTNRDHGSSIGCRLCDARFVAAPVSSGSIDAIVAQVNQQLGIVNAGPAPLVHVLLVQRVRDDIPLSAVDELFTRHGMTRLPDNARLAVEMLRMGIVRGFDPLEPWSTWTIVAATPGLWASSATPPAIAQVVRAIQREYPAMRTLSTSLSVEQAAAMAGTVDEYLDDRVEEARRQVRERTAEASDYEELASIASARREHDEAVSLARTAVAMDASLARAWEILGRSLAKLARYSEARPALERAIALDPTDALNIAVLAHCLEHLGDKATAAALWAKARAIGDPMLARLLNGGQEDIPRE